MELDKKYIAKMTRVYGLIVVISNIIAVMVPKLISIPVLDERNTEIWGNKNLSFIADAQIRGKSETMKVYTCEK